MNKISKTTIKRNHLLILNEIKKIIAKARYTAFTAVNIEMLKAYFEIGKKIVEEEQKGKRRAKYGQNLLETLSNELISEFGKGFDSSNLRRMRRFYLIYQKWETVSPKLAWSHYCELIKIDDKYPAFWICVFLLMMLKLTVLLTAREEKICTVTTNLFI